MEFKENKNNYYTKELNELDRYLLRTIKRYFDLEEINNAASINAIITEAIARYKSSINYENAGVDTLNNKFGIVNINITDLNGEKLFEKLSAFNKDFGTDEDNICIGNDERLSNKRIPTEHHHKILDIVQLRDILDEIKKELGKYGYHLHVNIAILNKLKYTGVKTQIDLQELESLGSNITMLLNMLETKKHNLINMYNPNIFDNLIKQIYLFMQNVYAYIENSNNAINNLLIDYIKQKRNELENIKEDIINNYPNINDFNLVKQTINNTLLLTSIQEINIPEILNIIKTSMSSDDESSMKNMYNNSSVIGIKFDNVFNRTQNNYVNTDKIDRWEYDNSLKGFVCKIAEEEHLMLLSTDKTSYYTHEVTITSSDISDNTITIILATYEVQDGIIYTLSLNISMGLNSITNNSNKMCITIGYQTEIQNEICFDNTFNPNVTEWNNNFIKIKIERKNNNFKIYRSELNFNTINNIPCIEFNLEDIGNGYLFEKASSYGYGCFSQKNSKFFDIHFKSYDEVILSDNIEIEQDINFSTLPSDYIASSIEIEPELVYNNTRTKIPYIVKDNFAINAGITNNKLYAKIQPLKSNMKLPLDITTGKIVYNIYSKRNIT